MYVIYNTNFASPYARKTQTYRIISESGLYRLISNSNKPKALALQNMIYQNSSIFRASIKNSNIYDGYIQYGNEV